MRPTKTFDQERVSHNLARLKKGGEQFEILIDPDNVILYKNKKLDDVAQVLLVTKIFNDAKKGFEASEHSLSSLFSTDDPIAVAKIILDQGEIQFTKEYRDQKRAEKYKRVIDIIARNAVDPRTHLPHPRVRIEAAFEEAKVRIDDVKPAQDQIKEILKKLQPILPIKFAVKEIMVTIPSQFAGKAYGIVEKYAKILNDNWQSDGSWLVTVEIPAGLQNDFFDALNSLTHGNVDTRIVNER